MSVAIVAMVNQTAIHGGHDSFRNNTDCPDTDYGNSSDHQTRDGEFIWSTKMQAYILSSFFYGYVITQVGHEYLHSAKFLMIIVHVNVHQKFIAPFYENKILFTADNTAKKIDNTHITH